MQNYFGQQGGQPGMGQPQMGGPPMPGPPGPPQGGPPMQGMPGPPQGGPPMGQPPQGGMPPPRQAGPQMGGPPGMGQPPMGGGMLVQSPERGMDPIRQLEDRLMQAIMTDANPAEIGQMQLELQRLRQDGIGAGPIRSMSSRPQTPPQISGGEGIEQLLAQLMQQSGSGGPRRF